MESALKIITPFVTTHSFFIFPEDLNHTGSLFGGKILAEMDLVAARACRRILYGTKCDGAVTACLERVDFKAPAHLGDIIELNATITDLGRTSIKIKVLVYKETPIGETSMICEAYFTFVALRKGKPKAHQCILITPSTQHLN